MLFLGIKTQKRQRKDGKEWAQALAILKTRRMGEVIEQKMISVKKPVLIVGLHASGKSRWIRRLYNDSERIWATRSKHLPLYLSYSDPLAEWVSGKQLDCWWGGRKDNDPDDTRHWKQLKPYEKYRLLPEYLRETGAVLFIEDANKFTDNSKKGRLLQECVRASHVWVMTASDEARLFPGLRKDVLAANPQIFRLKTDSSYDATSTFIWLMVFLSMALGSWEIAAVLTGLKVLGNGQRALRQA